MVLRSKQKRSPVLRRVARALGWVVLSGLSAAVLAGFYKNFLAAKLEALIIKSLGIDVYLLCYFLIYVFVICGLILVAIVYWLGWDAVKFKFKQIQYRSSLIVKDYYKEYRRVKYDRFLAGAERPGDGKLDLTGKEREEKVLANLEQARESASSGSIAFKNGKLDGIFVSYYENGKPESEVSYRDGKLDGPYRTYYGDGRVRAEKFYKDGKLHGISKAYDEDGSLFFEMEYKDGKQDGQDKIYYHSGVLQFLDIYKEGRRVHRKTYDEGGNLKFEQDY